MDSQLSEELISQSVAIIGMAGRFPGADSVAAFWKNLTSGVCSLETLSDDELRRSGVPEEIINSPRCIKRAGMLHNPDQFDAPFFLYSRREAELIDPQQRLFLECAWEAFEDAGYTPESVNGPVGVFAGAGMNYYFIKNLLSQHKRFEDIVDFLTFVGNDKDYLCSRVSYKLGLTGPSFVVNSACSTSLVAVQVGYQSLLTGQCTYALCGGVALQSPRARASLYNEGEIFSPDGCCHTFDKNANGIVFGEGLGLVLLKRTEDAIADKDHIYAIVRSAVVNQDGSAKAGFTAPGFDSQAELIALAQGIAGVHPDEIAFIEAHGTGTRLGDAIEVGALTKAFRRLTDRQRFCALGSVKTNIGHLDAAAGVTGLIKTALALKNRTLPASLNFTEENPEIGLHNSPFYVAKDQIHWEDDGIPLIAGLSSFGMGGTNAHVIMQEPPARPHSVMSRRFYLIPLSARSETALSNTRQRLQMYLLENKECAPQDLSYTLQTGRHAFSNRWFAVCSETGELIKLLSDTTNRSKKGPDVPSTQPVVFAFSGQGAQYPGMGRKLYDTEPVVQEILNQAREIMRCETGEDLFSVLFPSSETDSATAEQTLTRTVYTQPALFALEYAIARLFISFGIAPAACIGHSIGEYTAAAIAGVFTFEQGMKIILQRARIMDGMQKGSMASVSLPEKELLPRISGNLVIALVNSPSTCVISGPTDEVIAFSETMKKNNIRCSILQTSHAFHSPLMDEAARQFKLYLDMVSLSEPTLPFISNVSGTWITGKQCTSSEYWADHLRKTVRFSDGISELLLKKYHLFLEIGPGNTLSTLIGMHTTITTPVTTVQSLHHVKQKIDDESFFVNAIGELWAAGVTIDWSGFYPGDLPNRIPLPTYPFERSRYWIEYSAPGHIATSEGNSNTSQEEITNQISTNDDISIPTQMVDLTSRESLYALVADSWRSVLRIEKCDPEESFLVLGGNSLLLAQVVSRINERLPYILHTSFMMGSYTINEQVERLLEFGRSNPNASAHTLNEPIPHAEKATLSPSQQRLWYLCQLNQHTPAFNLTHTFRLRGPLDVHRLEDAIKVVVQRHPSLRSTFSHINGVPVVNVLDTINVSIAITDCVSARKEDGEETAAKHIRKEAAVLYDLEQGPLFKCGLYRVAANEYLFVFYIHHIISDGWSMAVILKELSAHYNTSGVQQSTILDPLKINYFDYAAYMNRLEERMIHQDDITFWKEYFKEGLPILSLPTDFPRPKTLKFTAKLLTFTLPPEIMRKMTVYAGAKKITPFSILLGMYGLLLHRNSRQERIIIGCPIAGRNRVEFEPLIGLFLNMIPFNIKFDSDMSIEKLADETYRNTVQVFAHQNIQFGKLVELLQPERHLNINHVFQTMFAYNNYLFSDNTPGEVSFEPEKSDRGSSEYDLSLYMWSSDDTLHGAFEYNDELFHESTIEGLRSQFQNLLEAALADPLQPIVRAPLFSDHQISRILEQKYIATCPLPGNETVHAVIDRSLLAHKEALAVTDGTRMLRYGELYTLSNQVCNGLRKAGVVNDTLVGVHMSRSVNLLPVMLGILKAGAAYIPLDPLFPSERIGYMIDDAALPFIVSDIENSKRLAGTTSLTILIYDDQRNDFINQSTTPPQQNGDGESLAYILYTSGSTGKPKGVEIQHKAVVNFLLSMQKKPGIDKSDNLLAVTTISFDISGLELFLPLTVGASITLVDSTIAADGFELKQRLEKSGATIMQATPVTWRMLLEAGWQNGHGFNVLCGGEAMSRELADKLLSTGAEVWNMYGPTETTIWSSLSRVSTGEKEPDLGAPIDNTQFFFLDNAFQEVPRGVISELCIAGAGLARGYHKNSGLTERKFVTTSIGGKNIRVYRTGDLVRTRADGTIEFLGRADQQVKIRGYRIELEEIETVLNKHATIKQAIVSTHTTPSGKELIAYVQMQDGSQLNTASIREHLGVHLPNYMVPAAFVEIDAFPLTPNGKVDRNRLPAPNAESLLDKSHAPGQKARDAFEEKLVQIWERFIGRKVNSIDDNYFELGGHSLLAVEIFNELHKEFDIRLPLAVLIEEPTIRTFAAYLRKLLHIPEPAVESDTPQNTGSSSGTPVQGLRVGYNNQGRPVWYVKDQDQSGNYVPLSKDIPLPVNPFSVSQKSLPSTAAQKEIWKLIHAHKQATTAFNLAISLQLSGKVIDSALDEAIQGLSVTHEILRGHLSSNGNEVIIESPVEIPISRIKIESPPGNQDTPLIQEYKKKEIEHPFDLHHGPLFRVTIIGSEGNGATILLGAHGSIIDEWSLSVLSRDLVKMYSSIAALEPPCTLPEYGYSDYVQYRLTPEAISQNQESIMYWHSRLALPPLPHPPRSLFYDKPHPASPTSHAHAVTHTFSNNTVTKMYSFATHHGVTLFSVLLAGFAKRIQHHTGVDDITTGVSYAGQLSCGMENTTGRFVNVIPTRFQLNTCPTFDVLCNHCHTTMISDCSEASVGIEDLAAELGYSPAKVQNLIATRCTFIQIPGKDPENSYHFIPRHATTANLELFFIEKINSLTVTVLGNDKLTTKEWLNTFAQELENEFEQNCIINKASVSEKKSSSFATTNEENILLNIWKRVLNVQDVGPDNDFYALGGNSLLAVQMINEINSTFKVKLSISIVLTLNTIAALADHIRTVSKPTQTVVITNPDNVTIKKPEWNTVVTFNNKGDLPPFFCVSGLGGNPMIFLQLSKLLGKNQPFYALQFRGVDGIMTPHNCVEDMATEFMRDIRKVQPEGPYYLGGYSFGGLVAYEMIQHLTKGGEPVGGLVLIDTFIPLHSKSVLKKSLLSRLSNLIPTGSGYNTKKLSDHLRVLGFQTRNKPDFANIFKNRFDLVASCNHLAGVQYKPQPTVANVLFIKSALGVPPDRYGHKLPFHSIHEWDNLIPPDRLDLRHTQTHHYELLNEPHLSETARNISGGLAALREKCGR